MNECKQCGVEYESKRSDSLYCGPTCRSKASRCKDATDNPLPVAAANKEPIHATDSNATGSSMQRIDVRPVDYPRLIPITSQHELNCKARGVNTCNTGQYKRAHELGPHEINRVSLPGDADY